MKIKYTTVKLCLESLQTLFKSLESIFQKYSTNINILCNNLKITKQNNLTKSTKFIIVSNLYIFTIISSLR